MKCRNHPGKEAIAACIECGNLFCGDCLTPVKKKNYCSNCAKKLLEDELPSARSVVFQQQQQQMGGGEKQNEPRAPMNWFRLISWLVSGVFFLMALGGIVSRSWAFIWPAIIGLVWLPPLNNWLKKEKNFEIPLWAKIVVTLVLLVLLGMTTAKSVVK